ncbi:P1 family peptidase [Rhodococcus sp. 3Y1]
MLASAGVVAGVDVRGGGPGTRETDLLDPSHSVQQVNAVLLTGGSAYGLAAADGVMRWLEEHDHGIAMGAPGQVVPIVPGAVIFDLPVGTGPFVRPAISDSSLPTLLRANSPRARSARGRCQSRSAQGWGGNGQRRDRRRPRRGTTVSALIVANPVGSVFDPRTGLPWGVGSDGAESFGVRLPTRPNSRRPMPLQPRELSSTPRSVWSPLTPP